MSRTTTKIIIAQQDGTVVGQYFLGQGEHLIGREIDCAIYIDDTGVSREHARLIISADAVEIEVALRSSHASFVGLLKQIKRGLFLENGGGYFFLCQFCLPFGFITVKYND